MEPELLGRWMVERWYIWQMRLLNSRQLAKFSHERGEFIMALWAGVFVAVLFFVFARWMNCGFGYFFSSVMLVECQSKLFEVPPWGWLIVLAVGFVAGFGWIEERMGRFGGGTSRAIPVTVKMEVAARDGGRCRHCGSTKDLQYDHIVPFSKGGNNSARNIQLLCARCNRRKGNRRIG